jgi:hypothetical protein
MAPTCQKTDNPQVSDARTADAATDRLVAETVGLLLEPLPLDEGLTGGELLELAGKIAELLPEDAVDEATNIADDLTRACTTVSRGREAIELLRRSAPARLLGATEEQAAAALRLLLHGGSAKRIRALRGVPDDALDLGMHDYNHQRDKLRGIVKAREATDELFSTHAQWSALDLNLDIEIHALRHPGRFFGLNRVESDAARGRVKPHLQEAVRHQPAGAIADVLEQVKAAKKDRDRLETRLNQLPAWTRWLLPTIDDDVRASRADALHWFLGNRETGVFGSEETALIRVPRWRDLLSRPDAQRLRERSLDEDDTSASRDAVVRRLLNGLAVPPATPITAVRQWRHLIRAHKTELAAATLAARRDDEPDMHSRIAAVIDESRTPFGPADPSRARYRSVLSGVLAECPASQIQAGERQHPSVGALCRELVLLDRQVTQALTPRPPLRGPLQVAIAGRTKAGKTTMRKALTGDRDPAGVGTGAHGTTRTADAFDWQGLQFVDTPGVAKYDDDFDAETAVAACVAADAVLWVYAETLKVEEVQYLQALLALGKPVIVVFNAKWRVDSDRRLALFARRPDLAFRDFNGHAARVDQIATAADVQTPLVLPVHLAAAWEATKSADAALAASAIYASKLPELEHELRRLLLERAQPLRAVALAEAVRTPLSIANDLIAETDLRVRQALDKATDGLNREHRELTVAVEAAARTAGRVLDRQFAHLHACVHDFIRAVKNDQVDSQWQRLLAEQNFDAIMEAFTERLNSDAKSAGWLLDMEQRLIDKLTRPLTVPTKPRGGLWRRIRAGLIGAARNVIVQLFTGARKLTKKAAAAAGARKVPWLGWALLAADAVTGATRAINDDVTASRIERSKWRADAEKAVRTAIDHLERQLRQHLDAAAKESHESIGRHFSDAREVAHQVSQQLGSYQLFLPAVSSAFSQVDLILARRLLALAGHDPNQTVRAERIPNTSFTIWLAGHASAEQAGRDFQGIVESCLREAAHVHSAPHSLTAAAQERDKVMV